MLKIDTASSISSKSPIQTKIKDFSAAVGIKREFKSGWNWDLSNVSGQNDFHFYGDQTFNASLGNPNKNHFDDGGFSFFQNTSNFNVSKEISGILHGMNLAAGAEYRMEQYKLYAGEEASYKNYNDTKATGSQGFYFCLNVWVIILIRICSSG